MKNDRSKIETKMTFFPEPQFQICDEFKVVGLFRTMSYEDDQTSNVWRQFMPAVGHIENRVSVDLISLTVYPKDFFKRFSPETTFEKWAGVEVVSFEDQPKAMSTIIVPSGLYAVFHYKGLPGDPAIFKYIFADWLNKSKFALSDRPHFEILGSKYKQGDPNSEEEIWIPVEPKKIIKPASE